MKKTQEGTEISEWRNAEESGVVPAPEECRNEPSVRSWIKELERNSKRTT
jgi:hypothetical protein